LGDQTTITPEHADTTRPAPVSVSQMEQSAEEAAAFLKAISHPGRLMALCHLIECEKTVGELEALLGVRQAVVSQQLSRLRQDGLVCARRDGKTMYYRLTDRRAAPILKSLHEQFCQPDSGA